MGRRQMMAGALAFLPMGQAADPDERVARAEGAVVQARLNEAGPFRFVIDSAASLSVVAADLAERLDLEDAGPVGMNTLIAREIAPTVRVSRFRAGAASRSDVRLALASRRGLDGYDGLVGADLLAGSRISLNFRGRLSARIGRSRRTGGMFDPVRPIARFLPSTSEMTENLLVLGVRAGRTLVTAIVDTGAHTSIVNLALARAAPATPITLRGGAQGRVQSPTGRTVFAQPVSLSNLGIGSVNIEGLRVLAGDFHTFDILGIDLESTFTLYAVVF